ncbi:hypothetical protein [Cellulosilyticum sp. WCF-2]|uniref:hypothetical protein n=1 Tax=Cellulosilyticum sp. WCF-2 TaxID=2497860 RepID=UPI000F8C3717|nr:hypothetical protein [Cellulosilyticum sp. WCF-2]QEH69940.1 hypothetical protein EKH84_16680 [Cellulosilyticum sp. WCF-2]
MAEIIKSDFQDILKDDCEQYKVLAKRYLELKTEDAEEAYALMKDAWAAAQRWSEIQASARKIRDLSERNINLTDLKDFAYQRYRQLQLMHESSRVIWKQANDYLMWERKSR